MDQPNPSPDLGGRIVRNLRDKKFYRPIIVAIIGVWFLVWIFWSGTIFGKISPTMIALFYGVLDLFDYTTGREFFSSRRLELFLSLFWFGLAIFLFIKFLFGT